MTFTIAYILIIVWTLGCGFIHRKVLYVFAILAPILLMSYLVYTDGTSYFDITRFDQYLNVIRELNHSYGAFGGLYRLLSNVPLFSLDPLSRSVLLMYSDQPFVAFYCWFFSLFPTNGLLRLGTALFFNSSILLICASLEKIQSPVCVPKTLDAKKNNMSTSIAISIFYLYFNYFFLLEGIRNFLAFALVIAAYFSETKKSKTITVVLYVTGVLLHPSAIIFCAIRLLALIPSKSVKFMISLALVSWSFLNSIAIALLQMIGSKIAVVERAIVYLSGSGSEMIGSANMLEIANSSLCLVAIGLIALYVRQNLRIKLNNEYWWQLVFLVCFTLGSFKNDQLYLRFIFATWIFALPELHLLIKNGIMISDTCAHSGHQSQISITGFTVLFAVIAIGCAVFFGWYKMTYIHGIYV